MEVWGASRLTGALVHFSPSLPPAVRGTPTTLHLLLYNIAYPSLCLVQLAAATVAAAYRLNKQAPAP